MGGGRDYGAAAQTPPETESLLGPAVIDAQVDGTMFVPLHQRTRKDNSWTVAWVLFYLHTVAAGVFTFLNRNVEFATQMSPDYLQDPSHCPREAPSQRRSLFGLRSADDGNDPLELEQFLSVAIYWLLGAVVFSLVAGLLFVLLVSHSPRLLVGLAIAVQVGLPLAAGTEAALQGQAAGASFMLMLAGAMALLYFLWREQLDLVVQLLGVSGRGLRENLGLVGATIGIQFGLLALLLPLLVAMLSALTNGHVAYNEQRAPGATDRCVSQEGDDVLCCVWQTDSHVAPILVLTLLVLLWTSAVGNEVRTFTVAGTIAQWYFTPVVDSKARSAGRVGRSFGAAMTTSFGSLCFGGLIITAVNLARSLLEALRDRAENNVFVYCLFIMVQYLFVLIDLVTKFATVRLAVTGEAFWDATRNVSGLLRRNFLDMFGVWWFPPIILQLAAAVLSLLSAIGVFGASATAWRGLHSGNSYAILLAGITFVLTFLVLSFFVSLLLNIIDAVFICFAMDRDSQACSRVDVHEVYAKLPSVGPVIENPDHSYAYGSPPGPQHVQA